MKDHRLEPSARMRSEGYGTWFVCLSVCLSVDSLIWQYRERGGL